MSHIQAMIDVHVTAAGAATVAKQKLHEAAFADALRHLGISSEVQPIVTINHGKRERVLLQGVDAVFAPGQYRLRALLIRKDGSVSGVVRTPKLEQVSPI